MSKRARYDGPHSEVLVFDGQNDVYAQPVAKVKRGGLLPQDVPARVRDELLAGDDWSEVQHSTTSSSTKTDDGEKG